MPNVYSWIMSGHEIYRGDFWQIVWHFMLEEEGENSAYTWARNLLIEVWDTISVAMLELIPENVILDYIQTKRVTGDMGPTATIAQNAAGTNGFMGGGTLNEGARIAWVMVDESHLGATIIPGIPSAAMSDEKFTSAYVELVEDLSDLLTAGFVIPGDGGDCYFMIQNRNDPDEPQFVLEGVLRERPSAIGRRTLR